MNPTAHAIRLVSRDFDPLLRPVDELTTPICILPSQHESPAVHPRLAKQLAIRRAILNDALEIFRFVAAGNEPDRVYSWPTLHKTVAWVSSDDTEWPYSFRNICQALQLDAARTRASLLGLLKSRSIAAGWLAHDRR